MTPVIAVTEGKRHQVCRPHETLGRMAAVAALLLLTTMGLASPALAADCPDVDDDDYVVCGGCDVPEGKACGDCNDSNDDIHPGAAELCDFVDSDCDGALDDGFAVGRESGVSSAYDCLDGIDNDGDGQTDLSDPQCAAALCSVGDPAGCSDGDAGGCCLTGGLGQCSGDGSATTCVLNGPQRLQSPESTTVPASCFDGSDNDCDDVVDHQETACQTAELCNGFDDDGNGTVDDGFGLGDSCTVGDGVCERTGTVVCKADQSGSRCSVTAGTPGAEGPAGSAKCADGLDNDCDTLTDIADVSCQSAEVCDGADNDGDGVVDNGFAGLGDACNTGVGACQASGTVVCKADGTGTVCSAAAALASAEGPAGATCGDSADNDCDGLVDLADPSCGAADLAVSCALPYVRARPGDDCTGVHRIEFETAAAGVDAVVTAELLALDVDGNVLASLPVADGDHAHLASRLDPGAFKAVSKPGRLRGVHEVFAPVPLLRVTVEDGGRRVQAFCSNIPYLQVTEPRGAVVSESDGDVIKVVAALPLVDISTVFVKVDGVDVLAALGKEPAECTAATPCSGNLVINTNNVTIADLVIEAAGVDAFSSNSLTMTVSGLGCGGHVFVVDAEKRPGSLPDPISSQCHVDDIRDKGLSSGFAVEIDTPTPGLITDVVPTPVQGQVCHGRSISSVEINGLSVSTAGQTFTPGDGEDSGDKYVLPIDVALGQTNLAADLAGLVSTLGTFDRGSNRLIAGATDDQANRAFATFFFGLGTPDEFASPGTASLSSALQAKVQGAAEAAVTDVLTAQLFSTDIADAFVLGMTPEAIQTFFSSTCKEATDLVETKLREALTTKDFEPFNIPEPFFSCDLNDVDLTVHDIRLNGEISCSAALDPTNNKIVITVGLPPTEVDATAKDHCCTGCDFICLVEVTVDVDATTTLTNMSVTFDITEDQITVGGESEGHLNPGTASVLVTRDGSDVGCLVGAIADVLSFLINAIAEIFTLGFADPDVDLTPSFEGVFKEFDLLEKVGIIDFPLKVKEIKLNEQEIANSNQVLTVDLDRADVETAGLRLSMKATFSATSEDPEGAGQPGLRTAAPAPLLPVSGAGNTFFVLSDDIMNQLFAAMTTQGELKTTCVPSGKTIASLAPADCDALGNFALRGGCKGLKGVACGPLPALEQGACVGVRNVMDNRNIDPNMELLFCGRVDNPPQVLIQDDNASPAVETELRLNDLFVGAVLDRNADDLLGGDLSSLQSCLNASADLEADCKIVAGCLDLYLTTALLLDSTDGKLRIVPSVQGVNIPEERDPGAVCEGGINFGDLPFLQDAGASDPLDDLKDRVDDLTPPLQTDGLDLGGIVLFDNPRLFSIETNGDTAFQDYLGITGDIAPIPEP